MGIIFVNLHSRKMFFACGQDVQFVNCGTDEFFMIKNLLFDLGGVIMDIEKANCVRAFDALGLPDAASFFGEYSQQGPFEALESGAIGPGTFRGEIRALIPDGEAISDRKIDQAFEAFLTGIPLHRLAALRSLRKKYGLYMLSNTNPIMWNGFIAAQFSQEGMRRSDYFDGITTSFAAKCLKPARGIFDYAATTMEIDPAETLFLDDSETNCRAAMSYGWQALHVPVGTEFMDLLKEKGVI